MTIDLGTVSEGTLLPESLIEAFTEELYAVRDKTNRKHSKLVVQANSYNYVINNLKDAEMSEELIEIVSDLVNELIDALNEYAMPYTYFGTLEGDGACFGWWIDHFALNEALSHAAPPVDEEQWIQDCFCEGPDCKDRHGYIVHINDHGNVTLMDAEHTVIWSIV